MALKGSKDEDKQRGRGHLGLGTVQIPFQGYDRARPLAASTEEKDYIEGKKTSTG